MSHLSEVIHNGLKRPSLTHWMCLSYFNGAKLTLFPAESKFYQLKFIFYFCISFQSNHNNTTDTPEMIIIFRLIILLVITTFTLTVEAREIRDISGEWSYSFPDSVSGFPTSGVINLPGTLDTAGIGHPVPHSHSTESLSRHVTYTGPVTFSRSIDIPQSAADKRIILSLERTRPSRICVDNAEAGSSSLISSPQVFDLSDYLTPGRHLLSITVDNGESIPAPVRISSHACSESTQTNWNGIIGEMTLTFLNTSHITSTSVRQSSDPNTLEITCRIQRPDSLSQLSIHAYSGESTTFREITQDHRGPVQIQLPLTSDSTPWSEHSPTLHDVTLLLKDREGCSLDSMTIRTGIRHFSTSGTQFTINGDTTFLRGRHDACVWPLTAHPPMDKEAWKEYFNTLREYGLNHVRFHSWCPPESCFAAADEEGFYLQPEFPIWGEVDESQTRLIPFLTAELEGILRAYSHHPSFVMFGIGNELWGDKETMRGFIEQARSDNDILVTYGANVFLGSEGHIPGEDYLIAARVGTGPGFSTHVRGSFSFADDHKGGMINALYPSTDRTFSQGISRSPVPVIAHETGQYQSYPDFTTISRYSGVLRPDNLEEWRNRADSAGLLHKGDLFSKASGKWAARLYKEEMEMSLRTPGMGGFHLLDIQDYPGQGTAPVGILDPFMKSKGNITPQEWRESCNDLTLLALLPSRTFSSGEEVECAILTNNTSQADLSNAEINWSLPYSSGSIPLSPGRGVKEQGRFSFTVPHLKTAEKVTLTLNLQGSDKEVSNHYDLWLYPAEAPDVKGATLTSDLEEALALLEKGKRVILTPDSATTSLTTIDPLFTTDFWNYRMFRDICDSIGHTPSPGTLGLLINKGHPLFKDFPTDFHTDWQWQPIIAASRPLVATRLPASVDPIVEPIDNAETSRRLAMILEFNVGPGKLLLIMADLERAGATPEGRWFRQCALAYAASRTFKPSLTITPRQFKTLLLYPKRPSHNIKLTP